MKKMNNKGFSLVELIIVIAIMAILIGVLAPQYLKYVEKSKVSSDKSTLDAIYNACVTAAADPDVTNGVPANSTSSVTMNGTTQWHQDVYSTLGISAWTNINSKFKSKSCNGGSGLFVSTDSAGNFIVSCGGIRIPEK